VISILKSDFSTSTGGDIKGACNKLIDAEAGRPLEAQAVTDVNYDSWERLFAKLEPASMCASLESAKAKLAFLHPAKYFDYTKKFYKRFRVPYEQYVAIKSSKQLQGGAAAAGRASAMVAAAGTGGDTGGGAGAAMTADASTGESASRSVLAAQSDAVNTGAASPPPQFGVYPLLRGASARIVFSGADGAELRHQLVAGCNELFKCDDVDGVSQAASRVYQYLDQDQDRSDAVELETIECLVLMYQAVAAAISNGDIDELNSIREENLREVFSTLIEEGLFSELAKPLNTGLKGLLKGDQGDEARGDVQAFTGELDEQYNAACKVQESIDLLGRVHLPG
jgi:hypothetical protein